ncbi:hypothetical protein KUTeg_024301 [Tegillarca granosa]|uniref:Uncharacterized protein n=1 Tax=Tegillarca granosa TaxID=220873 RepID=A0ABQ9DY02_TEGGR|nr:hypothetical protein KUTeg_024301 [Tegillarca granosa]
MPRAIMISMTIVIVTYLAANVAYLGVLSPVQMLASPAVAVTFANQTMGVMAWAMPVLIAISLILTLLYMTSNDIFFLIEMEGFGFASVLTMVFAGQCYLRYKEPNIKRPIKVPVALPFILFLISFSIVILTFFQKPTESLMALGLVAIGIVIYIVCVRWKHKPKVIQSNMDAVSIFIQKLLIVLPPDNADEVDWE